MSQSFDIHPDDVGALTQLRDRLRSRRAEQGLTIGVAAQKVGRRGEFVSMLERGISASPRMSSLQSWASSLGLRIEFDLEGFWEVDHDDSEMIWLYEMSRPWGKDAHVRLWLIAALRAWRIAKGIPIDVVAKGMGMHRNGAYRWEWESTDPLMGRAMVTARLLGTQVTMTLFTHDQWQAELES